VVIDPSDQIWDLIGRAIQDHSIPPGITCHRESDLGFFQAVSCKKPQDIHIVIIEINNPSVRKLPKIPTLAWGPQGQLIAAIPQGSSLIRSDLPDQLRDQLTSQDRLTQYMRKNQLSPFTPFFTFAAGTDVLTEQAFDIEHLSDAICWLLSWVSVTTDDKTSKGSIILSLEPAWEEVTRQITINPDLLHKMHSRKFEEMIAEMFASFGFEVDLTAPTRDGGCDIIALRRLGPVSTCLLVEAKRYHPANKIPPKEIRALIGTRDIRRASQVVLATSSWVSSNAKKEFLAYIPHVLSIIERDKILEWCNSYPNVVDIGGDWA
jgi:HJR/Mrr/RecB family endonuclease